MTTKKSAKKVQIEVARADLTKFDKATLRILNDGVGSALWIGYRSGRLINQYELPFLNLRARQLMAAVNKGDLDRTNKRVVRNYLTRFYQEVTHVAGLGFQEHKRIEEWVEKVLPFVTGEKQYEFVNLLGLPLGPEQLRPYEFNDVIDSLRKSVHGLNEPNFAEKNAAIQEAVRQLTVFRERALALHKKYSSAFKSENQTFLEKAVNEARLKAIEAVFDKYEYERSVEG